MVFVITTGGGGAGRFLIITSVCLKVSTTPLVRYVASAALIEGAPISARALVLLDVILNVFSPFSVSYTHLTLPTKRIV